jgi:hypothetical protein
MITLLELPEPLESLQASSNKISYDLVQETEQTAWQSAPQSQQWAFLRSGMALSLPPPAAVLQH